MNRLKLLVASCVVALISGCSFSVKHRGDDGCGEPESTHPITLARNAARSRVASAEPRRSILVTPMDNGVIKADAVAENSSPRRFRWKLEPVS